LGGQNVRDGAMVLAALASFNREYFRIDFVAKKNKAKNKAS
jgi:hypothetical protein